jgi:DNA-binding MarR family transcriptional regulator
MAEEGALKIEDCNCLAFRQAARHVTQFYDQFLAPAGLRTTQFTILAKLRKFGPITINALAENLVMDRTTLGRNIVPLEREGLIEIVQGRTDRRNKELQLTASGLAKLRAAVRGWNQAQARLEGIFGTMRMSEFRRELRSVAAAEL